MKTAFGLALTAMLVGSAVAKAQNREPLSALLAEAQKNNPDLSAAEHSRAAATHVKDEVTALPNPQFTFQAFGVGKPFAGFNSSDFAYIGIGASQELPFPGKRRVKGEAADAVANEWQTQIGVLAASIAEQIKVAYFRLAFLQQTLTLLEASRTTLTQIIDSQLIRYAAGHGSQTEALEAQLEHTKLVREITMHHQDVAQAEADLKRLLRRRQDSPDIVVDDLTPTALHHNSGELLDFVRTQNPEVRMSASSVTKWNAQVKSVERESKPDFSIGFMFERTGFEFPAYYMLTFGTSTPRRSRVRAEVAEASESLAAAKDSLDGALQQQLAETQKQYAAAASTAELLAEYRDGLIPQADALFRAGVAAYESNQQPVTSVLASFNSGLEFKRGYYQTLLDHEVAIAHLERLTGKDLR